MKILVVYRHFWPDSPPYASMLRSIGRRLAADGYEVTLWCERPCYKLGDGEIDAPLRETLDGIAVRRFARLPGWRRSGAIRLADKLLFVPRTILRALATRLAGRRYDLVWTATIPPVLSGWAGRSMARLFGARFLYHCQDLYPELGAHMGMWSEQGLRHRLLARIEAKTRRRAHPLVTLSDDMAATVRMLAEPHSLAVINNFMLEDFSTADSGADRSPTPDARDDDKTRLIFAGNLGIFQELEVVIDAMRLVADERPDLELVLMGDGKALPKLLKRSEGLANVRFEAHRPFDEASREIAQADAGLVTLEKGVYRYAFPSKTLTYLGLGLPMLAIVEPESELAGMIVDNDLGVVAPSRDAQGIAKLLRTLRPSDRSRRDRLRGWYAETMASHKALDRWAALIGSLRAQTTDEAPWR